MNVKKGIQIITATILFIGIAAYFVYAIFWAAEQKDATDTCANIELAIRENRHSGFINAEIVEDMLRNANIYPKGRPMDQISTRRIEETLKTNDFVESVTCYKTANNKIHIDITQRTPVIYILRPNGAGYYVDSRGKIIPKTTYPVNMPIATGNVTQQYAQKCLSKLGNYITSDEFWNSQIEQMDISANADGEYIIDIIPRVGNQIIRLGTIDNYTDKLNRLRTFYKEAVPSIGWNKYTTIDLEYDGQIICKKHKTK